MARITGVLVAAASVTVAFARVERIPAYRWFVLRGAQLVRSMTRQESFRSRILEPRQYGVLRLPGEGSVLRILDSKSAIGAVHDTRRRRLIAVAKIEGPAHLLQNAEEQDRRVSGYGQPIAGLCQGNRICRAQILERTLPDPGDGLGERANQRGLDPGRPLGRSIATFSRARRSGGCEA